MHFNKIITINGEECQLNYSLSEFKTIKNFARFAYELKSMMERKQDSFANSLSLSIKGEAGKPLKFTVKLPDQDDKSVLLHGLRPFILKNEDTYLIKICNLLSREIESDLFRHHLRYQKKIFNIKKDTQAVQITENVREIINSEETLKIWLNAYEYHRDTDKIEQMERLTEFLPIDVVEYIMIDALLEKAKVVLKISEVVQLVINPSLSKMNVTRLK